MANVFEYKKNDFEHKAYLYDRKMELVSEDEKTQSLFNEILSVFDDYCACVQYVEVE